MRNSQFGLRAGYVITALCLAGVATTHGQTPRQHQVSQWRIGGADLRIGAVDGPDGLTAVTNVLIDATGRIFVHQAVDQSVLVFEPSGRRLMTIGKRGRGPGEFQTILYTGFVEDTLWVADFELKRISFFDRTGQLARTVTQAATPLDGIAITGVLQGGRFLGEVSALATAAATGAPGSGVPIVLATGGRVDTIARRPVPRVVAQLRTPQGQTAQVRVPTAYRQFWKPGRRGDYFLIVDATSPGSATVHRYSPDGARTWSRTLTVPIVPVTAEFRNAFVDAQAARLTRQFGTEAAARRALASVDMPPSFAPVADVVIGTDDRVWLQVADPDANEWLILDNTGTPEARVQLPRGVGLKAATDVAIYGVVVDSNEIPFVVRHPLIR